MQTIRATIDHGEILLQEPLPNTTGRFAALLVIEDGSSGIMQLPASKLGEKAMQAEEEFEAIGLRDFFGESIDESINWETYFSKEA